MMGGEGGQEPSARFNPYGGGRPKSRRGRRDNFQPQPRNNNNNNRNYPGAAARLGLPVSSKGGKSWYRVSIPHAKKIEKTTLLTLLGNHLPPTFKPFQFHYENEMGVFHVDDRDTAELIKSLSRTITMPNSNLKIFTTVKLSSPPYPYMNEENIQKLQVVMSQRYDPSVKMLDLSRLYEDKNLQEEGLYLALNREQVMSTVTKIIQENIPELVGLNLSHNRLLSLSGVQDLVSKTGHITSLNLSHNQLRDVSELDKVKGWQLLELLLERNPLCDHFKENTPYVSAVRKRFPKLLKLDGKDLPPPITFDIEKAVIPVSKGSHFVNSEVQDLVVKFLKEYYTIYDSDNRQPLIDAYHEHAIFSVTSAFNPAMEYKQPNLAEYLRQSRNALKVSETEVRRLDQHMKKGRLVVVAQLTSMPKTTHDANSLVVDVNFVSNTLLSFSVNGLFKEADNKADKPPIRAFSRCFVAVPAQGGVLIISDMLTITNATSEQTQAAFKSTGPTPSSSPVSSNPPALTSPSTSTVSAVSPDVSSLDSLPAEQQQMVLSFSQQSGMSPVFSFRCLADCNWDYNKAAEVFTNLNSQGKIPPEAFQK